MVTGHEIHSDEPDASLRFVRLGHERLTGDPVVLPIRHMVVTAGKTTTLESLIRRTGRKAVTFITKRGEGSFTDAQHIRPYFREQGEWQYVASILEASRGEKMRIERAFIIRASKGAKTLADVQRNVRRELENPKTRGLAGDIYLCLDAYLEVVVPIIERTDWANSLDLKPGVNAIDLTNVPNEMQHLVIQSTLDWVLHRETRTIVVIPEAWKFTPQGRGTPVKRSAVALMRQGAALENYVWLDSQDLGGIDKEVLRQVPVWLLGAQRETNEIKRTLDNIPDGLNKPTRAQIAMLQIGQFYACWGREAALTYVQPWWLTAAESAAVARMEIFAAPPPPNRLRELVAQADERRDQLRETLLQELPATEEMEAILEKEEEMATENIVRTTDVRQLQIELAEAKSREAALKATVDDLQRSLRELAVPATPVASGTVDTRPLQLGDIGPLYEAILLRLKEEAPQVLKVMATRNIIEIHTTPNVMQIDGDRPKARAARLIAKGWFNTGKTTSATRRELARTGADPGGGGAFGQILRQFVKDGFLTEEGEGFVLAPGVKISNTITSA